ncbi:MAG: adenosylhomocysteinase, partial [Clostridia bacterium]
ILCNAGHFDVEVDVSGLRKMAKSCEETRANIEGFTLPNDQTLYLLAQGRLVNLAAGDGHPVEIMDMSFALQALCVLRLSQTGRSLPPDLYAVPADIDQNVALRKLEALDLSIDTLTSQQTAYLL